MHFILACFFLVSTRLHKHALPNSAVIKTTCLNFGAKQCIQIFLSCFNTTLSVYYLAHIVGHFLLAALSHGTGLTHGIACTRVLPTSSFCLYRLVSLPKQLNYQCHIPILCTTYTLNTLSTRRVNVNSHKRLLIRLFQTQHLHMQVKGGGGVRQSTTVLYPTLLC